MYVSCFRLLQVPAAYRRGVRPLFRSSTVILSFKPTALKRLALASILAAAAGGASASTLVSTVTGGPQGHTYQLWDAGTGGITWTQAAAEAASGGRALASLTSAAEISFVTSGLTGWGPLTNGLGLGPWVGGQSTGGTGSAYVWLDGNPISGGSNGFSWGGGQPDYNDPTPGAPQGVLFYPDMSHFGDYGKACGAGSCNAGKVLGFVTEVPEPASTSLAIAGLGYLGWVGRSRRRNAKAA